MSVTMQEQSDQSDANSCWNEKINSLEEEALEAKANSRAVMQVVESLLRPQSVNEVAQIALDSVRESFGWTYGSFWAINEAENCLQFATDSGTVSAEFQQASESASFERGVGISGRAWKQQDIVFVKDIGEVKDCCRAPIAKRVGVKSGMCVPIIVGNQVIGTMDFFVLDFIELSDDRLETLRSIGRLVSACIERLQAAEQAACQAKEIKRSQESLQEGVSTIQVAVEKLVSAGAELKCGNDILSTNAGETATQANVVSAAAEEISNSLQAALTGTQQVTASVSEIARSSADAATVAEDAVKVSESTTEAIGKLGDSSQKIGDVVKVISSIAGQTNLLALNATIEAARAGEAGKGFAVVANEVKELAKQTAEATEDISERIDAIQSSTNDSVKAITEITAIISKIYDLQNTIATAVEEQAATTREIEQRLAQAAQGSGEVAKSISTLADAAKSTDDAVAKSNAMGQEVVEISSLLESTLGRLTSSSDASRAGEKPFSDFDTRKQAHAKSAHVILKEVEV